MYITAIILMLCCGGEPGPLPTESQLSEPDGGSPPPLYQLLYDGSPQPSIEQQRLRGILWLQRMDLSLDQLNRLEGLRREVVERQKQIELAEREHLGDLEELETPVYNRLWDRIRSGQSLDSQEIQGELEKLRAIREADDRHSRLLSMRVEAIRSIFSAEEAFLQTLSPEQEDMMVEALFFLRNKLDPLGSPMDFYALVGTTYEPGQYAVLTRGTGELAQQNLNIGGLWSDNDQLTGKDLHEARREVVLYMALMEPGLDEALRVARELR